MVELPHTPYTVTRTFRTSIRIGEDFYTLEESITLPMDASDEQIAQAVDLGWRIYQAQHDAFQEQVASVRESHPLHPTTVAIRDPDAPATERQRNYIATLQNSLSWNNEELATHASTQGVDLVTLTRGQASTFIDNLKKMAEERTTYHATLDDTTPASSRQQQALQRLAQERGFDLDTEAQRRYGVLVSALSGKQAGALIVEWQKTTQSGRTYSSGEA